MDSRLLMPATPALLDGWCGPVVLLDPHERGADLAGAHLYRDGQVSVFADWTTRRTWSTSVSSIHGVLDRVMLDLSRAEARDRVKGVLAAACGCRIGGSGFTWSCTSWLEPEVVRVSRRGWNLHTAGGLVPSWSRLWRSDMAALVGLDPNDDTRLPDGSRLVDALALAAVAREVLRG